MFFEVTRRQIARKTTAGRPPSIPLDRTPPSKSTFTRNLRPPGVGTANSLIEYEGRMLVRLTRAVFHVNTYVCFEIAWNSGKILNCNFLFRKLLLGKISKVQLFPLWHMHVRLLVLEHMKRIMKLGKLIHSPFRFTLAGTGKLRLNCVFLYCIICM